MAKKKKGVKKHFRERVSCTFCGITHDSSHHRFHGKGSFARTHKPKRRKKGKR